MGKAQMGTALWILAIWITLNALVVGVRLFITRDLRRRQSVPHPSPLWTRHGI